MHNPKVIDFGSCILRDSLRGSEQMDGSMNWMWS